MPPTHPPLAGQRALHSTEEDIEHAVRVLRIAVQIAPALLARQRLVRLLPRVRGQLHRRARENLLKRGKGRQSATLLGTGRVCPGREKAGHRPFS
jgi:hypothetical protein